jgi:hypothetical protein
LQVRRKDTEYLEPLTKMGAELLFEVVSRAYERLSMIDLRVMGPESEVFLTLFKSSIYVLPFVAQGVNEIVMMTMVIMMITGLATFCYSCVGMQEEIPRPE